MEWTLKLFWFSNFSFSSCLTYYSFWELAFKKKKSDSEKNNVMADVCKFPGVSFPVSAPVQEGWAGPALR